MTENISPVNLVPFNGDVQEAFQAEIEALTYETKMRPRQLIQGETVVKARGEASVHLKVA